MFSENSHVAIFGASGDIGSALARRLVAHGVTLTLISRASDRLDGLATELNARSYGLDATDFEAVATTLSETHKREPLTGVVNCVGSIVLKNAHLTSYDDYLGVIHTNLTSAFAVVRSAGKLLRKTGGSLVLLSSCAASVGLPRHEAISAAKAGVEGLTRSAAASYARYRIRVNAVAPGLVATKLSEHLLASEAVQKASVAMHPLGRLGQPSDIAHAIAWLLSDHSEWVTGQILRVDGGLAGLKT